MRDSILQRIGRIMNARLEDAVDRMEWSGSDGVMREAIREVDRAIDQVRGELEAATATRLQAVRRQKLLQDRVEALTGKAQFAIGEGRDDLAEAALSRQLHFEAQLGDAASAQIASGEEEARLEAAHDSLTARRQELEEAMRAFTASRHDAPSEVGEASASRDVEHRVVRAEQAFDRAMVLAGGDVRVRGDADTIRAVAEIDTMRRRTTIAARLADLKLRVDASPLSHGR